MGGLYIKIISGSYKPISTSYSAELSEIIDWCLQKHFGDRPSIHEILSLPKVQSVAATLGLKIPTAAEIESEIKLQKQEYISTFMRKKLKLKLAKENARSNFSMETPSKLKKLREDTSSNRRKQVVNQAYCKARGGIVSLELVEDLESENENSPDIKKMKCSRFMKNSDAPESNDSDLKIPALRIDFKNIQKESRDVVHSANEVDQKVDCKRGFSNQETDLKVEEANDTVGKVHRMRIQMLNKSPAVLKPANYQKKQFKKKKCRLGSDEPRCKRLRPFLFNQKCKCNRPWHLLTSI
uniref:non-specific serine/threonine protein kinase n=1 Tax=Euplotes harpa TaxID=151035 RepID=A0A7S3N8Q3_9SPIT|mmetsp:Transcript_18918/g.21709  ORF Transcript_18918/g.21709 Transcript_18918/m.21709 type:complete len:296 (+) Transcript_18918:510-1397(+)